MRKQYRWSQRAGGKRANVYPAESRQSSRAVGPTPDHMLTANHRFVVYQTRIGGRRDFSGLVGFQMKYCLAFKVSKRLRG